MNRSIMLVTLALVAFLLITRLMYEDEFVEETLTTNPSKDAPAELSRAHPAVPSSTNQKATQTQSSSKTQSPIASSEEATLPTPNIEIAPHPLTIIPSYREELGYSGADAEVRFHRFVDMLRGDRESSADYLHNELAALTTEEKLNDRGQRIVFLLGHIGHKSSIPHLISLLELEEPLHEHEEGCADIDGPPVTKSFAAHSLEMIATRYNTPDTVIPVAEALEDILRDPEQSSHLKVSAAMILLAHAADPATRTRQLANWMGEDAYLLDLQIVEHSSEMLP